VELYLPASEYDLETVTSVLYSLCLTALAVVVSIFSCFPESKASQKISKVLQKVLPSILTNSRPAIPAGARDSEVSDFVETCSELFPNYGCFFPSAQDDDWTVVNRKSNKRQQGKKHSRNNDEDDEDDDNDK
jgi:hypothetical protein